MVKRQVEEPDFGGLVGSQEGFQREGTVGERANRADCGVLRHDHHTANFGQGVGHLGEATGDIVASTAVAVAVGSEQHHRTDLPEPVDHPRCSEVGRRRREGGADGCGGKHHRAGLGDVG